MNKIATLVIDSPTYESTRLTEKLLVANARLTQHGEKVHSIEDFMALLNKPYTPELVQNLCKLPHPTLQKFGTITIAVIGASRRFLAQITRHQNEVKFMSASLQYSDYSTDADFFVPYAMMLDADKYQDYCRNCRDSIKHYVNLVRSGVSNDDAGYLMPQALRNVLVISATPYQWKHMIGQRVCRRNTDETRYVMLKCWEALIEILPNMFQDVGCSCITSHCNEGRMSCGKPIADNHPTAILHTDFPVLFEHYDVL